MNSSSSAIDSITENVQLLRLAEKVILTPPPSDDSQKSAKSTSNHSDHLHHHHHEKQEQQDKSAYIESLKEEREQLSRYSDGFNHVYTLIDKEIKRFGGGDNNNFNVSSSGMLSEIVPVPVDQYPTYNFVGRILGPRGTTAHQIEETTGCRVTILGRVKKDAPNSDPNAPVDNGPLRVQVSVPADASQAAKRMERGVAVVKALLVPPADGQDELKRQQLMILANMNGTYHPRHPNNPNPSQSSSPAPPTPYSGAGDYGHQFQNLLPHGYRLPGGKSYGPPPSHFHHSSSPTDCFNPKCTILRSLVEQTNNGNSPKVEEMIGWHMYELLNRICLANSSLYHRQGAEMSKAQEIGNRMCSSMGVPRRTSSSTSSSRLMKPSPRAAAANH